VLGQQLKAIEPFVRKADEVAKFSSDNTAAFVKFKQSLPDQGHLDAIRERQAALQTLMSRQPSEALAKELESVNRAVSKIETQVQIKKLPGLAFQNMVSDPQTHTRKYEIMFKEFNKILAGTPSTPEELKAAITDL